MNDLATASSPYLQQFKDSNIQWRQWDAELIKTARKAEKLLHISIGRHQHPYSKLEIAAYNDPAVAEFFNEMFINAKVDADERPDVERWLLTGFEHSYGTRTGITNGTYPVQILIEPKQHTMVADSIVLFQTANPRSTSSPLRDSRYFLQRAYTSIQTLTTSKDRTLDRFTDVLVSDAQDFQLPDLNASLETAIASRKAWIDRIGQGAEPSLHEVLGSWAQYVLQLWLISGEKTREATRSLDEILNQLTKWVRSADFDHVNGGFFHHGRTTQPIDTLAVKSLAANAAAIELLANALSISRDGLLEQIARETATFLENELRAPEGCFYLSVFDETNPDAKWQRHVVKRLLTEDENIVVETLFGLDRRPDKHGRWLIARQGSWRGVVGQLFFGEPECSELLDSGLEKLRKYSNDRAEFSIDKRILVRPNAQLCWALFRLARTLDEPRYAHVAQATLTSLLQTHYSKEFGLTVDGNSSDGISLLDYALVIRCCIAALAESWDHRLAGQMRSMALRLITEYRSDEPSFVRFSNLDKNGLVAAHPFPDRAAEPRALPIIAHALQVCGILYQDQRISEFVDTLVGQAFAIGDTLEADLMDVNFDLLQYARGATVVVVRGPEANLVEWRDRLTAEYKPWRWVFCIPDSSTSSRLDFLPIERDGSISDGVVAHISDANQQLDPIYDLDMAVDALSSL